LGRRPALCPTSTPPSAGVATGQRNARLRRPTVAATSIPTMSTSPLTLTTTTQAGPTIRSPDWSRAAVRPTSRTPPHQRAERQPARATRGKPAIEFSGNVRPFLGPYGRRSPSSAFPERPEAATDSRPASPLEEGAATRL